MVHTVTPEELAKMIATQAVDLVDVREPSEWDAGHIHGTRLVPLETFRADPDAALRHGMPIVFICERGRRSLVAAKLAERFGYDVNVIYNLEGGTREWIRLGLSVVTEQRVAA